jgi:hypothetical protein
MESLCTQLRASFGAHALDLILSCFGTPNLQTDGVSNAQAIHEKVYLIQTLEGYYGATVTLGQYPDQYIAMAESQPGPGVTTQTYRAVCEQLSIYSLSYTHYLVLEEKGIGIQVSNLIITLVLSHMAAGVLLPRMVVLSDYLLAKLRYSD